MTRGHLPPIAAVFCFLLASACSEPGAPAVPGDVVVTLTAPSPGAAAIMLALDGPGVLAIAAPDSGHVMFWHQRSSTEAMAIVIGQIDPGPLITARIPDVASRSVHGKAAADRGPGWQPDQRSGYAVTVARSATSRLP